MSVIGIIQVFIIMWHRIYMQKNWGHSGKFIIEGETSVAKFHVLDALSCFLK
jgi:hypothetical protein